MTKGDSEMITVKQPDTKVREGYRMVEVIGLFERPATCDACGYPFDAVLSVCPACGVAA